MRLGESREDKEFSKGHIVPSIESDENLPRSAFTVNYDHLSRLNEVVNLKRDLFFSFCPVRQFT